ncbi:MAG: AraC family ligand binding domain-containing protein [Desulfomonilaceae bacterium]
MNRKRKRELVKYWRIPQVKGVDLLNASYVTQTFSKHTHEGYAVGVVESGALGFVYRGETLVASPGTVNLVIPGEPHNGFSAADGGWTYRMFYLDAALMEHVASQVADRKQTRPFFRHGVIHVGPLAKTLGQLHRAMEDESRDLLEKESLLLMTLAQWIHRHAEDPPVVRSIRGEHRAVRLARDYIESHFQDAVSLEQIASISHLSAFHLIRVFQREVGLSPHAYLTQVRVERARALILRGWTLACAAAETGFTDQSHLTRHFKHILESRLDSTAIPYKTTEKNPCILVPTR